MAREKGKPNKNKAFLLNRLKDIYGEDFHPIMSMAKNAVKLQSCADEDPNPNNYKIALEGWEKIAQYVEPKLKAIELTGNEGKDLLPSVMDTSGLSTNTLKELLEAKKSAANPLAEPE